MSSSSIITILCSILRSNPMIAFLSVGNLSIYVAIVLLANLTNARLYLLVALCVLLSYILDIVEFQDTASKSGWPLQNKKKMVCVVTEMLCFSLAAVAIWRKFLSLWE